MVGNVLARLHNAYIRDFFEFVIYLRILTTPKGTEGAYFTFCQTLSNLSDSPWSVAPYTP